MQSSSPAPRRRRQRQSDRLFAACGGSVIRAPASGSVLSTAPLSNSGAIFMSAEKPLSPSSAGVYFAATALGAIGSPSSPDDGIRRGIARVPVSPEPSALSPPKHRFSLPQPQPSARLPSCAPPPPTKPSALKRMHWMTLPNSAQPPDRQAMRLRPPPNHPRINVRSIDRSG